jgi:hypothetical protein
VDYGGLILAQDSDEVVRLNRVHHREVHLFAVLDGFKDILQAAYFLLEIQSWRIPGNRRQEPDACLGSCVHGFLLSRASISETLVL